MTVSVCVSVCVQTSEGGAECFKDMTVGVYKEIVPMGMDPDVLSYQLAGTVPIVAVQIIPPLLPVQQVISLNL